MTTKVPLQSERYTVEPLYSGHPWGGGGGGGWHFGCYTEVAVVEGFLIQRLS